MENSTHLNDREVAMLQLITSPTHHSAISADTSEALMAQRPSYVAAGRPADHPYARSIALIEYDRPAIGIRCGDGYVVVEV